MRQSLVTIQLMKKARDAANTEAEDRGPPSNLANRRFPRPRLTVGAEVIGSPSAKLCAHPPGMYWVVVGASHHLRSQVGNSARRAHGSASALSASIRTIGRHRRRARL
jgi:hypothetical protein